MADNPSPHFRNLVEICRHLERAIRDADRMCDKLRAIIAAVENTHNTKEEDDGISSNDTT